MTPPYKSDQIARLKTQAQAWQTRAERAEAALARMSSARRTALEMAQELEAQLAEARGLLERWLNAHGQGVVMDDEADDTRAFLAGRPAPAERCVCGDVADHYGHRDCTRADPRPAPEFHDAFGSDPPYHPYDPAQCPVKGPWCVEKK